jgi:hypothetical protein
MENLKLKIKVQPIKMEDSSPNEPQIYEGLINSSNWNEYVDYYYDLLIQRNTNHIQLNGFRNRKNIPDVLLEIKYKEFFDKLKQEAFQFLIMQSGIIIEEEVRFKPRIINFRIDKETENLIIVFDKSETKANTSKETSENNKKNSEKEKVEDSQETDPMYQKAKTTSDIKEKNKTSKTSTETNKESKKSKPIDSASEEKPMKKKTKSTSEKSKKSEA